jgi:farnesyl diphosphate synthase
MRIVTYKTAFYSFYLPVACGLLIGGAGSPDALRLARGICVEMGQYFQVRLRVGVENVFGIGSF